MIVLTFLIGDKIYPLNLSRYQDTSTIIYGENTKPLHVFLTKDDKWRLVTKKSDVTPLYVETLLAREDRFYYFHPGVNPFSIFRALYQAARAGHIVSGGSTLTMQTARLLEPHPRTIFYKLIECFRAIQLEWHFSKNEILNMYMTLAPFGSNIEGVKAASMAYFNKTPQKLNASEVALLVAMVQSPNQFRPDLFPNKAIQARQTILELMLEKNLITKQELQLAKTLPIPRVINKFPRDIPHLAWRLKLQYLNQNEIKSTINDLLQYQVEYLLNNYRAHLPLRANAAILILDYVHHRPIVYVASRDFLDPSHQGFVDYIKAYRSPGSTLKPFIYGLSFDLGLIQPDSYMLDARRRFGAYYPHNIDKDIHGMIKAKEALSQSLNIPAVWLLNEIGVVRFLALLKQANVEPKFPKSLEGPSLPAALGGLSLSLEQLVCLYSGLANNGKIRSLSYLQTDIEPEEHYLFSDRAAQQVTDILAVENSDGRKVSVKTGTSYGHRDALALGYDNQYVVGIWIGIPNGSPMGQATGSSIAVPLLNKIFQILPKSTVHTSWRVKENAFKLKNLSAPGNHENTVLNQVPQLLFPVDDSVIALENQERDQRIPCKVFGGVRPYTWLVNEQPVITQWWQQQYFWTPDKPGFYTISVIDAKGQSARANIEIKSA